MNSDVPEKKRSNKDKSTNECGSQLQKQDRRGNREYKQKYRQHDKVIKGRGRVWAKTAKALSVNATSIQADHPLT